MQKKNILKLFSLVVIILLFLSNCVFEKIDRLAKMKDNDIDPKWDLKFDVPVLDKSESMKSKIGDINPTDYDQATNNIPWPLADTTANETIPNDSISIASDISIDIDGKAPNPDIIVSGIQSSEALLTIEAWVTHTGTAPRLTINRESIHFISMDIEGVTYYGEVDSFTNNNTITFKLKNFPQNNFLNFSGAGLGTDFDFANINFSLNGDYPPAGAPNYDLHAVARFSTGEHFGAVSTIQHNDILVSSKTDTPVPLGDLPFSSTEYVTLAYEYYNPLPFGLKMTKDIKIDGVTVQTHDIIIPAGALLTSSNGYSYVETANNSSYDFNFMESLLGESEVKMDYSITIINPGGSILIDNTSILNIKAVIKSKGEIDL